MRESFPEQRPPLVDLNAMGRLIRAARIVAGFDAVDEAVRYVEQVTGHHITARTLYAIERGEQPPTLEQLFALIMAYRPIGGGAFFNSALRPDLLEVLVAYRMERDGGAR